MENKISATDIGLILLNGLLGGTDPNMVIGNSGIGPYAEERENLGAVAMVFINPELGSEKLLLKTVTNGTNNLWRIGSYKAIRGLEKGLDAHHAGQSAIMKRLVAGYEHNTAPAILIPDVGHRFLGPNGIVSRSTKGFTNARQVLARDIFELRRVYGPQGIPNSALQELIQMNKTMYPGAFIK